MKMNNILFLQKYCAAHLTLTVYEANYLCNEQKNSGFFRLQMLNVL